MDMQLGIIWMYSNAMAREARRDAFSDPLDSPEWDGLIRVLMLATSIVRRITSLPSIFSLRNRARETVKAVPDHGVCVS